MTFAIQEHCRGSSKQLLLDYRYIAFINDAKWALWLKVELQFSFVFVKYLQMDEIAV